VPLLKFRQLCNRPRTSQHSEAALYRVHKSPPLVPMLSETNPAHSTQPAASIFRGMPCNLLLPAPTDMGSGQKFISETLVTIYQTVRRQSGKNVIFMASAVSGVGLGFPFSWSTSSLPHRAPPPSSFWQICLVEQNLRDQSMKENRP
jgi:hypothetical protein